MDNLPDAVFRSRMENGKGAFHFLYNIQASGKKSLVEEIQDFYLSISEINPVIPVIDNLDFNGNDIPDHIAVQPYASLAGISANEESMPECGKIYVYFDKIWNEELVANLKEQADLVLSGEQKKEIFGRYDCIRITDYNRDGIDDLVVLSPYRDYKVPKGDSKNDAGGVYIYSGKTLWNFYNN